MLLDRVKEVFKDPFPHVIVENALPETYYEALVKSRPSMWQILNGRSFGPNQRIDMRTQDALKLDAPWDEFIAAHISSEFFNRAMELFYDPAFELFEGWDGNASLRCQPGINTPSPTLSSVRGPHLDNPSEIYAGLFYMPVDEGGDLEIYRWAGEKKFHGKLEVQRECVELVKTVPYKPNTYVMFLNTPDALHGVTPRQSKNPRYLVNVIADANKPLFRVGHNNY
jgi:hypothetical protein